MDKKKGGLAILLGPDKDDDDGEEEVADEELDEGAQAAFDEYSEAMGSGDKSAAAAALKSFIRMVM